MTNQERMKALLDQRAQQANRRASSMTPELHRTALHEAGHSYAAWRLGRRLGPVTVRAGRRWAGTSHYHAPTITGRDIDRIDPAAPYPLWPATVRRKVDTIALVAAAGEAAEYVLHWPVNGSIRRGQPLTEQAAEQAALQPTQAEELRLALARADTAGPTDAERLASLAAAAHGEQGARLAWLHYINAEARSLIAGGAEDVLRLAQALEHNGSLSGRAARTILETP